MGVVSQLEQELDVNTHFFQCRYECQSSYGPQLEHLEMSRSLNQSMYYLTKDEVKFIYGKR